VRQLIEIRKLSHPGLESHSPASRQATMYSLAHANS